MAKYLALVFENGETLTENLDGCAPVVPYVKETLEAFRDEGLVAHGISADEQAAIKKAQAKLS